MVIAARVIHIAVGVFWAGTVFFLDPTRAEIGTLKTRARTHSRWIALWLAVAVFCSLAVARYL